MRNSIIYTLLIVAVLLTGCSSPSENPSTIAMTNTESSLPNAETVPSAEAAETLSTAETVSDAQEAEAVVKEFADAYFVADSDVMKKHLSRTRNVEFTVYEGGDPDKVVINAIKGLENISADIEQKGYCYASVEFKKSAESDYYIYLTIEIILEDNQWKIAFYTLEM